ncbi:MAG: hypothetical protein U5Q44_10540 [Dehalococcoidia bacterium]|nr:hypothetical protein [Dehalococcoidia bacterium]
MNEDQSKRLAEAADSVLNAADAIEEAREALNDRRFESEQDRERTQAVQHVVSRFDAAAKRIDEALRKGIVAATALDREGLFDRYRSASAAVREGRSLARTTPDQDGSAARKERAGEALARLEAALTAAAGVVFDE